MKVFVTGGTGYSGGWIVRECVRRGHEVSVLTRNPERDSARWQGAGVQWVAGDLEQLASFREALTGHEVLLHHGLIWDSDRPERDGEDAVHTRSLFRAAAEAGISRILFTSSTAVHRPFSKWMSAEDDVQPQEPYGRCKQASEIALREVGTDFGIEWLVLRVGPIIGPSCHHDIPIKRDRALAEMLQKIRNHEPISVARNAGRQWIAGESLAQLYAEAVGSSITGETLLCVSKEAVLWQSIAGQAISIWQSRSTLDVEPGGEAHLFDVEPMELLLGKVLSAERAMTQHLQAIYKEDSESLGRL